MRKCVKRIPYCPVKCNKREHKFKHLNIYYSGHSYKGDWAFRDSHTTLDEILEQVDGPGHKVKVKIYCDTSYAGVWCNQILKKKLKPVEGHICLTVIAAADWNEEATSFTFSELLINQAPNDKGRFDSITAKIGKSIGTGRYKQKVRMVKAESSGECCKH